MSAPPRNTVDLHTHTARSDGVLEPLELYRQMRAWGSSLVAITDHDTLEGARELLAAGLGAPGSEGPRLLVGVEINTRADETLELLEGAGGRERELHILGLGVDPEDASLRSLLEGQRAGRELRIRRTLERLAGLGLDVEAHLPQVPGGIDALGRPHVARALVSAGFADSVQDAFERYLVPGGPAYIRREGIGPRAAIEAIAAAGGVASLAHYPSAPDEPALIGRLMAWGLRGLEVHYHHWRPELVEAMGAFADSRGLLRTGGSDYHGDTGPYAASQEQLLVPPQIGERVLAALPSMRA